MLTGAPCDADILLVGTGKKGLFPPPAFKKYLNGLGIQVDVLDSVSAPRSLWRPPPARATLTRGWLTSLSRSQRNACATYNLLAEEGRRVAAALYPITDFDARTGTVTGSS